MGRNPSLAMFVPLFWVVSHRLISHERATIGRRRESTYADLDIEARIADSQLTASLCYSWWRRGGRKYVLHNDGAFLAD
jgi:hypothetical protein